MSSGGDNLLAGILGALEGAQRAIDPFAKAQLQSRLNQQEWQNRLNYEQQFLPIQQRAEMDMFKQKLPLETESKIAIARATPTTIVSPTGEQLGSFTGRGLMLRPPQNEEEKQMSKFSAKLKMEQPKAKGSLDKTISDYDELIRQAESIRNDSSLSSATGLIGGRTTVSEGQRRIDANLQTIKAKTLLNVLGGLKELSATGASGFGQLSNVEGETIKNSIENLSRTLGTKDFKNNMDSFIRQAKQSRQRLLNTYNDTYKSLEPMSMEVSEQNSQSGGKRSLSDIFSQ